MGNVFLNRLKTTLDITWRIQSVAQVWFIEPSYKSDPYNSISSKELVLPVKKGRSGVFCSIQVLTNEIDTSSSLLNGQENVRRTNTLLSVFGLVFILLF